MLPVPFHVASVHRKAAEDTPDLLHGKKMLVPIIPRSFKLLLGRLTCLASACSRIVLIASRAPSRRLNRFGRDCCCCDGGAAADCTEDAAEADDLSPRLMACVERCASDSSAGVCGGVGVVGRMQRHAHRPSAAEAYICVRDCPGCH